MLQSEFKKENRAENRINYQDCYRGLRHEIEPYEIKKVIFNDPATIVLWKDGTKTVVKCCEFDSYDPYVGVSMAICKKLLGNDYKKIFKKAMSFCENEDEYTPDFTHEWAKSLTRIRECLARLSEYCEEEK